MASAPGAATAPPDVSRTSRRSRHRFVWVTELGEARPRPATSRRRVLAREMITCPGRDEDRYGGVGGRGVHRRRPARHLHVGGAYRTGWNGGRLRGDARAPAGANGGQDPAASPPDERGGVRAILPRGRD